MSYENNTLREYPRPRILVKPSFEYTDGYMAYELGAAYGLKLDSWQLEILKVWCARDEDGKYVCIRNGLSAPRQNGKTAAVKVRMLFGSLVLGERIMFTAHEYSTVMEMFEHMKEYFGEQAHDPDAKYPKLNAEVLRVSKTNGKEAIILKNGGAIIFSTRTKSAKRGFSCDIVIFDEAQELTEEQQKAIMLTASASPKSAQLIYLGTPPSANSSGDVFARIRNNVLEGRHSKISWFEWSVDEIGDVSDRERWYATNPTLGERIDEDFVAAELDSLAEDSFAQERLGWWPTTALATLIQRKQWERIVNERPTIDENTLIAYGVKFSRDGASVSLAVATRPLEGEGLPHIEVIAHKSTAHGIAWLVDWLIERKDIPAAIVIDGPTGAGALIEKLYARDIGKKVLVTPTAKDVIAAHSMIYNAIQEGSVTHYDQPALNDAALNSVKRDIGSGGGWGWKGVGEVDVTPLDATTLAFWGVMTTKRRPGRKQRVIL